MKTKILKIFGEWQDAVDDCRATVGKESLGHEPSADFKRRILISEHSPIREIVVKFKWPNIKSWIATHFSRHKWECFIETQRTDRTGINRDELRQDAIVSFTGIPNAQNLIDTMRKRLCYQAAPETIEHAEDLKIAIYEVEPELSDVLVCNCCYRCGCPEMQPCGYFEKMLAEEPDIASTNIQKRYDAYNRYFWKHKGGKDAQMEEDD